MRDQVISAYIRKHGWGYAVMLAIGLIALLVDCLANLDTATIHGPLTGIASSFIPVGLGGLLILLYSKKSPRLSRNIEMEMDERNTFVRDRSGHTAFQLALWYVFALTMLANFIKIPQAFFGVSIIVVMSFIYFLLMYINFKKY